MTSQTSDTPKTDDAAFSAWTHKSNCTPTQCVSAAFARGQERRIAALESRLELWGTNANGERERLPDHLDGIACRDETIRQLESRATVLRTLIGRIGVAYCNTHGTEWQDGCYGCSEAQRLTDTEPRAGLVLHVAGTLENAAKQLRAAVEIGAGIPPDGAPSMPIATTEGGQ